MDDSGFMERVFEIYKRLVMAEHDASKNRRPVGMRHDSVSDDWVLGYHAGVGNALDLLGPVLGLGVKFDEEGNAVNG